MSELPTVTLCHGHTASTQAVLLDQAPFAFRSSSFLSRALQGLHLWAPLHPRQVAFSGASTGPRAWTPKGPGKACGSVGAAQPLRWP